MEILRRLLRGTASYLFKLFILLLAVVSALVITFHSPKKIDKSLSDSGVYSTFVDNALQEAKKSSQNSSNGTDIPIDNPAVSAAAKSAFTPQVLQKSTESLLNGTYDWLSGKAKSPDFNIDLTPAKQTFATGVGQAAADRLNGLPVCSIAQLKQLGTSTDIDPFTVPCKPPRFNIADAQAKVVNDIATSKDFISNPILNAQSLPKDQNGQTVFDKLSKLPKVYKWVNASPWILAALAIIAATLVIWLHDNKRRGWRSVAISLGLTGILLFVFALVSTWALHKVSAPTGGLGNSLKGSFQQTIIKGINSLYGYIEHVVIWFGGVYLLIAIAILAALHFIKPKSRLAQDNTNKTDQAEPTVAPKSA